MKHPILQYLRRQVSPVSVANVARALGLSAYDVREALHELAEEGRVHVIRTEKRGEWFAAASDAVT